MENFELWRKLNQVSWKSEIEKTLTANKFNLNLRIYRYEITIPIRCTNTETQIGTKYL